MRDLRMRVVDDSPTMRKTIIGQLGKAGFYDVGEAEDGLHGLEELETGDYNHQANKQFFHRPIYEPEAGSIVLPDLPGLGLVLDEEKIEKREEVRF